MGKKISEVIFDRYQHLAEQYAKSIWDLHKISMEYDDLVQELSIKMYGAILAYGKRWKEYRETGKYKPINLDVYLRNTLINRSRDFIKRIEKSPVRKLSIENSNRFDVGFEETHVDLKTLNQGLCEVGGVDVFQGLDETETKIFSLYLKGYELNKLAQMFATATVVVERQIDFLKTKKHEIYEGLTSSKQHFVQYCAGE